MKILYAITTYDGYAYVDLSLTLVKDKKGIDCIVLDDGSYSQKLQEVCEIIFLNFLIRPLDFCKKSTILFL